MSTAEAPPPSAAAPAAALPIPTELLKSRSYLALLFLGALIGVPVAAIAYFFLVGVGKAQTYVFATLPKEFGFSSQPQWWPFIPLFISGVLVALSIQYLPGTSGHEPAEGFKAGGLVQPSELPGIIIASFATLALGVVLGPEAPLIAIGSGLGVLAVHLLKKDAPQMASVVIGAAGSFAAISTLLGSPLVGAFLLMEASGIGGPLLGIVLVPGLLAAGIGSLIFVGLDHWTGLTAPTLSISNIPHVGAPSLVLFLWAIAIGLICAVVGSGIRRIALWLQAVVTPRRLLLTPVVGLGVGVLVLIFTEVTGKSGSFVLFSGQTQLPTLIHEAGSWAVGSVILLIACKAIAYGLSLSSFRGGPIFPALFVGSAIGIALSHVGGLPLITGVGLGIGGMSVAMLGLPLVSVLLPALFLAQDAVDLLPLIIVAVVVSYVASAHVAPKLPTETSPSAGSGAPAPGPAGS